MGEAELASSVVAKAVAKLQVCALYGCEYSSFHQLILAKQQARSKLSGAQTSCALILRQNIGNKRAPWKCGNKSAHSLGEAELASSVVAKVVAKLQVCALYGCEYSSFHR